MHDTQQALPKQFRYAHNYIGVLLHMLIGKRKGENDARHPTNFASLFCYAHNYIGIEIKIFTMKRLRESDT